MMDYKRKLKILLDNYKDSLDTSDSKTKDVLKKFVYSYNHSDIATKNKIKKYIRKLYRPSEIKPKTVGSYLFGCLQNNYGDTDKKNSILSYESVGCEHLTPDRQIWYQNEVLPNRFRQQNYPEKYNRAYIYVKDDFEEFTVEEIQMFKDYEMLSGTILKTSNSKHYVYKCYGNTLLSYFPQQMKLHNENDIYFIKNKILNSSNYFYVIFLIVIIAIVVILYYYREELDKIIS